MPETIIRRTCCKCKRLLPLLEFHKDRRQSAGYSYSCKACKAAYGRSPEGKRAEHRHNHTEASKNARWRYRQTAKGKRAQRVTDLNQRAKFPERVKARDAVGNAIRSGTLPKACTLFCHECGQGAQEYHHYLGYAPEYWLDVVPLCIPCHYAISNHSGRARAQL